MKIESIFIQDFDRDFTFHIGEKIENDDINILFNSRSPNDLWIHAHNCSSSNIVVEIPEGIKVKDFHKIVKVGAELCNKIDKSISNNYRLPNQKFIYAQLKYLEPINDGRQRLHIRNHKIYKI